jgi:hypothetical protein
MNALLLLWVLAGGDSTWEFDAERAHVVAHGDAKDDVTALALTQLGVKLDGDTYFKVSAHANSVGGVTLRLSDYNDEKSSCDLYATRKGDLVEFTDSRCSFPAFSGSARSSATCRKISGTARHLKQGVALTASSPDCTAQPMGFSLSGRATVKPFEEKEKK